MWPPKFCLRLKEGERVVLKPRVCSFRVKGIPAPSRGTHPLQMHLKHTHIFKNFKTFNSFALCACLCEYRVYMHVHMHVLLCTCGSQDDLQDSVLPPRATVYLTAAAKDSESMSGSRKTQAHSDHMSNHDVTAIQKPTGPDLDRKGHRTGLHLTPGTCHLNLTLPDEALVLLLRLP